MHTTVNNIVQHLFRKPGLDDIAETELTEFVSQYPYFAAGHYLLASKTGKANGNTNDQHATATLYINNPLWMQWLLERDRASEAQVSEPGVLASAESEPPMAAFEPQVLGSKPLVAASEAQEGLESPVPGPGIDLDPAQERGPGKNENAEDHGLAGSDEASTRDEPAISFQSYHTIDYFASQGIRLQQAELAKDKLGQQLKSFTEWLRSMKKLPSVTADTNRDKDEIASQQNVVQIAQHSIEEKEVLTEAMAEVWAKQGNTEKAIAVYQKLSLQKPYKSGYFASRIDQLKAS